MTATETKSKYQNWSTEEDQMLKECVLEGVREGRTQLLAFESIAIKTGRTPGSVGFRWNNKLRKECASELKKAKEDCKKQNKSNKSAISKKKEHNLTVVVNVPEKTIQQEESKQNTYDITYDDVLTFMKNRRKLEQEHQKLQDAFSSLSSEYQTLKADFEELYNTVSRIKNR